MPANTLTPLLLVVLVSQNNFLPPSRLLSSPRPNRTQSGFPCAPPLPRRASDKMFMRHMHDIMHGKPGAQVLDEEPVQMQRSPTDPRNSSALEGGQARG